MARSRRRSGCTESANEIVDLTLEFVGFDKAIDAHGAEAIGAANGLGLLPVTTTFSRDKTTRKVRARADGATALWTANDVNATLDAYEIHMGRTVPSATEPVRSNAASPFAVVSSEGSHADGCSSDDGLVVGTYMHGLLENSSLRRALLDRLASRKGVHLPNPSNESSIEDAFDSLADVVHRHLDVAAIDDIIGIPRTVAAS